MRPYLNEVFEKASKFNIWNMQSNEEIIGLNWADPFYPNSSLDERIKKACEKSINSNALHYTLPIGDKELREELVKKIKKVNNMEIDATKEIIVVPGADAGLFFAMIPFIQQKDEVIILEPSYACNYTNTEILGAIPVRVDLNKEDYSINFDNLEKAITKNSKMLVLTNPNNPTGRSYTKNELEKLAKFVEKHDLVVVVDQAFEDTVYKEYEMITFASIGNMDERTVTVYSMSKGYGLCGFRVGYVVSNEKFIAALGRYTVSICGVANTMAQQAAIEALKHDDILLKNRDRFEERNIVAYDILKELDFIKCIKPQAGFYLWLDISSLGTNDEVCQYIKEQAKIAVTSGTLYGGANSTHIRVVTAAINDDEEFKKVIITLKETLMRLYINKNKKGE